MSVRSFLSFLLFFGLTSTTLASDAGTLEKIEHAFKTYNLCMSEAMRSGKETGSPTLRYRKSRQCSDYFTEEILTVVPPSLEPVAKAGAKIFVDVMSCPYLWVTDRRDCRRKI